MESYDKGKESGKATIGNTVNGLVDKLKTKEDMQSLFAYLWGVRDAYTDTLSMYMENMIPIPMPEGISDAERAMYWELSSHIIAYYNTIKEMGSDQHLVDDSAIKALDIVLGLAKSKFSHEVYMNMISAIRDHIDEVMVAESHTEGQK